MEANTTISEIQKNESARPDIQVVTSDTFKAYVDDKLADPDEAAKKELKEIEDKAADEAQKKAAEEDPAAEFIEKEEDVKKPRKEKLNERFRELTAGRKAAEERAAENEAARKAAEERAAAKEREIEELRSKYEPPKKADPDPKPSRAQFGSDDDFEKALTDWTRDAIEREQAQKQAAEKAQQDADKVRKQWLDNLAKVKQEIPDYEDKIRNSKAVLKEGRVTNAVVKSEEGPAILAYLADNEDVAQKLQGMDDDDAVAYIGRIAERITQKREAAKTPAKDVPKPLTPISPIRGGSGGVGVLHGNDDVPKSMSYDEWAERRRAGKIH